MHLSAGPCIIRPWHASDLVSLVEHANNRKIWLQLRNRMPYPYSESDGRAWLATVHAQDPATNFAIEYHHEAVGSIGVTLLNDIEVGTAEVGYWIGEAFWGRGLATAALRTFAEWAFEEFELRRLFAGVMFHNHASRRVLEKTGFVLEGIHRQHVVKEGIVQDQAYYGLLREDLI